MPTNYNNNFKLTLDTLAPNNCTVSTSPSEGVNVQGTVTLYYTNTQDSDAVYMKTWIDKTHYQETIPDSATWILFTQSQTFSIPVNDDGNYYGHAVFLDSVGNQTVIKHSSVIVADRVAPTVSGFAFDNDSSSHDFVNDRVFSVSVTAQDVGTTISGLNYVRIYCADLDSSLVDSDLHLPYIEIPGTSFTAANQYTFIRNNVTFTSSATEGMKSIYIRAFDNSGNIGMIKENNAEVPIQIYFDPNISEVTTTLKDSTATTNLNPYVNNSAFTVVINTQDTDIAKYKLWGSIDGYSTTEPETWTTWPSIGSGTATISGLNFSSGDGTKTIYVKVQDSAGNIATATPVSVVYDATNPAVSISAAHAWIASIPGEGKRSTTTITYTASDSPAGINSITFTCQNGSSAAQTITGISGGSFTFSASTTGADVGSNTITITVVDNAGNTNSASVVVGIESGFSLSSLGLSGTLDDGEGNTWIPNYYNATTKSTMVATVVMNNAPASGRSPTTLYFWSSTIEDDAVVPANPESVNWGAAAESKVVNLNSLTTPAESNGNYLHVKAVSDVGNTAYLHESFVYDITSPVFSLSSSSVIDDVNHNHHTNQASIILNVSNITELNIDKMKITTSAAGSISQGLQGWTATTAADKQITITVATTGNVLADSGAKDVIVHIRDKAGNVTSHQYIWEYDAKTPSGTVELKEPDGVTLKDSPTNARPFRALITYLTDSTDIPENLSYKIYGDFSTSQNNTNPTAEPSSWTAFGSNASILVPANGGNPQACLWLTPNGAGEAQSAEGVVKDIWVKLKDDAGNINTIHSTITYNPNQAELHIVNVNHEIIGVEHALRKTSDEYGVVSDLPDDYADMIAFTVNSNQKIVEWKVAAYIIYPNSETTGDLVTPISKLSGSTSLTDYYETDCEDITSWNVMIDGKDYRNALAGGWVDGTSESVDGIHYIVVFAKNKAGTWTIAGTAIDAN